MIERVNHWLDRVILFLTLLLTGLVAYALAIGALWEIITHSG